MIQSNRARQWFPLVAVLAILVGIVACYTDSNGVGTARVSILEIGSGKIRRFANVTSRGFAGAPIWSPDGKTLTYMANIAEDNSFEIYTTNINTRDTITLAAPQNLPITPQYFGDLEWLPDSKHLLYRLSNNNISNIYVMNPDGSNPVETLMGRIGIFNLSPDGTRIAYSRISYGDDRSKDKIYVTVLDSDTPVEIVAELGRIDELQWSPDGSRIAFIAYQFGHYRLYTTEANGNNLNELTNSQEFQRDIDWSPDGTRIAYWMENPGRVTTDLHTINSDGSDDQLLAKFTEDVHCSNWSPKGDLILFGTSTGSNKLYTVNPEDGSETILFTGSWCASWLPDGNYIAFFDY